MNRKAAAVLLVLMVLVSVLTWWILWSLYTSLSLWITYTTEAYQNVAAGAVTAEILVAVVIAAVASRKRIRSDQTVYPEGSNPADSVDPVLNVVAVNLLSRLDDIDAKIASFKQDLQDLAVALELKPAKTQKPAEA